MTEQQWLGCERPDPMLECLRGKGSDRKLRLFACACCRRVGPFLEYHRSRQAVDYADPLQAQREYDEIRRAVEVAERVADGLADPAELGAVFPAPDEDDTASAFAAGPDATWTARSSAYTARWLAAYCGPTSYPPGAGGRTLSELEHDREEAAQVRLLRDLFGNPFRPVALDPAWWAWRDGTIPKLAQAIYDDRAFDRLPILADALEDAGCTDGDILNHCRQPGEHVRGCWVVDLLLGKE
jgi:hypothetical protein